MCSRTYRYRRLDQGLPRKALGQSGKIPQSPWQNVPPLECFLRHIIARHECDTRAQLKDIRVPTLVLVGAEDHISASNLSHRTSSEELAKGIPNAQLALLPGECHHFFYTEPAAAHKIIRDIFWERVKYIAHCAVATNGHANNSDRNPYLAKSYAISAVSIVLIDRGQSSRP